VSGDPTRSGGDTAASGEGRLIGDAAADGERAAVIAQDLVGVELAAIEAVDIAGDAPAVEAVEAVEAAAPATPPPPPASDVPMWRTMASLFRGEYPSVTAVAICSFVGGLSEAALLVLIANLALAIGGDGDTSQQSGIFGFSSSDTSTLFLLALALTVARLLVQFVAARLMARTIARLTQRIRTETFDAYVHASWELQASESEAAIQDLLIRHVAKAQAALSTFALLLSGGFMVLALISSAFVVDAVASALIVLVGLVLFVALRPLTARAKQLSRRQVQSGLTYGVQSQEAVELSLEIRAFGVSDQIAARLDEATRKEVGPLYRQQLITRMLSTLYSSAAVLILLVALLGLDTFLQRPLASIGAIVVVLIRALNQTSGLQTAYHNLGEFVPYIEHLDEERERFRRSQAPHGAVVLDHVDAIRFDSVSYSYDGQHDALRDIDFEVARGESVGIIGPSGSGKSTLIQLLLRLRHPQTGRYLVGDVDATEIDDDAWFSLISFVPQDSRVFDDTIAANIRFFRDGVTQDDIEAAARRAHVHDEIMAMPDGYATVLGSRGGSLSGGQRQRVAIARALVGEPSMLVLDEPTSALDMHSEALVHETLNSLKGSITLFVIAHRLSTLNTCDRIMVMRDGELQAFGLRSELEADNDFYRQALELSRIRS